MVKGGGHRIRFFPEFILPAFRQMKCKSLLDFFKFNSESEILKGPDHSEPSVSGLP